MNIELLKYFPCNIPLEFLECRVWRTYLGGFKIDEFLGNPNPCDNNFPENWIGSTVQANNPGREDFVEGYSVLRSPKCPEVHVSLKDLLDNDCEKYLGMAYTKKLEHNFGLLVKLLDSAIRLPIQAHPSRETAKLRYGSLFGKTESWIVLGTREIKGERPYVLLGFKPGVTKELWRSLYESQNVKGMVDCLHKIYVKEGDVIFVRYGIPHAIGPGCFLCEVQEPSDLVYRTELVSPTGMLLSEKIVSMGIGIDAMMDEFDYDSSSSYEDTIKKYKIEPVVIAKGKGYEYLNLLDEDLTGCFSVRRLQVVPGNDVDICFSPFAIVIVITGVCKCSSGSIFEKGASFFIPNGCRELNFESVGDEALNLLLCFPSSVR